MTLNSKEIIALFKPAKMEKESMDRLKSKKRYKDNVPTLEALFKAYGLIFKPSSCDRIAAYGVGKFILEATEALLGNKEITLHIQKLQGIAKQIKILKEQRREIEEKLDKLEYCDDQELEKGDDIAEIKLLKGMGITPTTSCGGDSFLRYFLLSFMESKTPEPTKKYGDLVVGKEKTNYIESLERRISELEAKP